MTNKEINSFVNENYLKLKMHKKCLRVGIDLIINDTKPIVYKPFIEFNICVNCLEKLINLLENRNGGK